MTLETALSVSASGLSVQRTRLKLTASNIANAETTRGADGGPYRRRDPVVASVPFDEAMNGAVRGARITEVQSDSAPPRMVYDPDHPDAASDGMVAMPNINPVDEMVNLLTEQRAFEANATAFGAAKTMIARALDLLR